ncbi:MAG TPA: SDR family NAD(P)-dependent oxidoreductase [Deltaproteobacteria bacterium]|jgi:short-subunit dehydrogenase|nr:SDR family NAD(P)-dependent oxidoreductase [Deltaproteobacteria bacterium]HOI07506.1 SDR family NAD(P)-dependent oxidoreductase [Deltaproteobacteria bacterium]
MEYFRNRNILVTGAFGGFGRCFTQQLLDCGANLILSDMPQAASAESLGMQGTAGQGRVVSVIPADLSTGEGCRALYDEFRNLGIGLDMIVYNAGIGFGGNYLDVPLELNEKVISVNLLSVMRLNALFLPGLISRGSGHLIYVSSVAGFVATSLGASYSTSKFGVRAFAMAVHGEVRRHGIRTTIVYPFYSKTPILRSRVFGDPKVSVMPGFCASSPEHVVACALKGARRGRLHVCPGFFSKLMWAAVRLYPVISDQRRIAGCSS